jgi:hypothetical protein
MSQICRKRLQMGWIVAGMLLYIFSQWEF